MTAVTTGTDEKNVIEKPSRTAARRAARADAPGTLAAAELAASGALDGLFEQIDAGELELTGDGGFIPALIKTALERGLQVELTDHLGTRRARRRPRLSRTPATGRRRRRWAPRSARSTSTSRGTGRAPSRRGWCPRAAA